ncbi:hypothetical protein LTR84_000802 [Exophiala bonariae]|uniref:Transcription factor domain-containing protein n=1 Tax=Exophiala bonariae TaxID=1690606 RepID=A0AAV9NUC7_9EURO|nr:hypothetical protein LTR84_000802 [Exophiala bonariae]
MALFTESPGDHFVSPSALSNHTGSLVDEFPLNPRFQELQTTLRSYLFDEARGTNNTNAHTPEPQAQSPSAVEGHQPMVQTLAGSNDRIPLLKKINYLNIWITECAPWLDMFDSERHFGIQVPILAQRSPAVLYALLALAARQSERYSGMDNSSEDCLELYSQAISSLAPSVDARSPEVLITACILCVLEMMSVSPRDWRRHSEGCAALFESSGVNGFSAGLLQAVFWCYARMDLCAAIISNGAESTTLPITKWALIETPLGFPQESRSPEELICEKFLEKGAAVPDMHANYAVYLCAQACDLLARRTRYLELGEDNGCTHDNFRQNWIVLWDRLERWVQKRPPQMLPAAEIDSRQNDNHFPSILFAHWAAISGNQLYHTACVLMMEMVPPDINMGQLTGSHTPLWHARCIVGISLTNPHRGCLNNAIQPLYLAGKLFTHHDEHKVIIDLLNHIEACSGWGSRWRIKSLESFWGYRTERRTTRVARD